MMSIHTPSPTDVLCGKDKTYELHPGNQRYRDLINSYALQYAMAHVKQDKMNMTARIVSELIESGSRFLRPVEGGWEKIHMSAARDKTSHALRFCAAQMEPPLGPSLHFPLKRSMEHRHVSQSKKAKRSLKRKVSFDETKKADVITPDTLESKRLHKIGLHGNLESDANAPVNLLIPELTSSSPSVLHDISSGYDDQVMNPYPLDFDQEFDILPEYSLQYFVDNI